LRAFIAAPNDPETLYLLSRRPGPAEGGFTEATRSGFEALLREHHPDRAEAVYFQTVEQSLAVTDLELAEALVGEYARAFPEARGLAGDLQRLITERRQAQLAGEAEAARQAYEHMKLETDAVRKRLEDQFASPAVPEAR
jgi:hypothetical protein